MRQRRSYEKKRLSQGRGVRPQHIVPDGHRYGPDCDSVQPIENFPLSRASRTGRGNYCKPYHDDRGKRNLERLHGGSREYHLRRRCGITGEQYDAVVAAQGGVCALCGERAPEHVDHDHLTGRVRGVLCSVCNQGLGNFRDSSDALRAAGDYLERTTVQRRRASAGVFSLTYPQGLPPRVPAADLGPLLSRRGSR